MDFFYFFYCGFVVKPSESVMKLYVVAVNLSEIYFLQCVRKLAEDTATVFAAAKSGAMVQGIDKRILYRTFH